MPDTSPVPSSPQAWLLRIQAAEDERQKHLPSWQRHLRRYEAQILDKAPLEATIAVPKDFAKVEAKKAQLFFRSPDVQLTPRRPNLADAVTVFQPVLNRILSRDGVDAKRMAHEVLFDALCPSGIFATKIGYDATVDGTIPLEMPAQPTPVAQPGAILGLQPDTLQMPAEPVQVPNVIHEQYFWERISPAKLLIPAEWRQGGYDRAPWLGFAFAMDRAAAIRKYELPADFQGSAPKSEHTLSAPSATTPTDQVCGYEIWYRAAQYREEVKHPEQWWQLVIFPGYDSPPAVDRPSPYQKWVDGQLTGMRGNPIHVGSLRTLADSAYPPSDVNQSGILVEELSKGRTQMLQSRDRRLPRNAFDSQAMGTEEINKITQATIQEFIPVPGISTNPNLVVPINQGAYPQENFLFNDIINRDIDEVWALGANQQGLQQDTRRTATELNLIQGATDVRLDAEREVFLSWYVAGVAKLASLVQLFADTPDYIAVVGEDGAQRIEAWDKTRIQGEFVFDVKPDSAIRIDAAQDRKQAMELYSFLARDPNVNRVALLEALVRKHGLDPAKVIVSQLPEAKPEPPKASLAIKGDDLAPQMPQFSIVREILAQLGVKITDDAIAQGMQLGAIQQALLGPYGGQPGEGPKQDGHPGLAEQVSPLNKHQSDLTGGMQGFGGGVQ